MGPRWPEVQPGRLLCYICGRPEAQKHEWEFTHLEHDSVCHAEGCGSHLCWGNCMDEYSGFKPKTILENVAKLLRDAGYNDTIEAMVMQAIQKGTR